LIYIINLSGSFGVAQKKATKAREDSSNLDTEQTANDSGDEIPSKRKRAHKIPKRLLDNGHMSSDDVEASDNSEISPVKKKKSHLIVKERLLLRTVVSLKLS